MSSELASLMKTLALKVATIVVLVVGAQAVVADCGQIGDDPKFCDPQPYAAERFTR
jgi:hypothetical protein